MKSADPHHIFWHFRESFSCINIRCQTHLIWIKFMKIVQFTQSICLLSFKAVAGKTRSHLLYEFQLLLCLISFPAWRSFCPKSTSSREEQRRKYSRCVHIVISRKCPLWLFNNSFDKCAPTVQMLNTCLIQPAGPQKLWRNDWDRSKSEIRQAGTVSADIRCLFLPGQGKW